MKLSEMRIRPREDGGPIGYRVASIGLSSYGGPITRDGSPISGVDINPYGFTATEWDKFVYSINQSERWAIDFDKNIDLHDPELRKVSGPFRIEQISSTRFMVFCNCGQRSLAYTAASRRFMLAWYQRHRCTNPKETK